MTKISKDTHKHNDVIKSFEDSLLSEKINSLNADLGEVALDAILNEGILREIPFVREVTGLYKIGLSFRLVNYLKKLNRFFFLMNDVTEKERKQFLKKIERRGGKQELFERIMILLEKLESVEKADIVGRLFVNMIKEKIKTDEVMRLSLSVDRLYIYDLMYLNFKYNKFNTLSPNEKLKYEISIDFNAEVALFNAGLMNPIILSKDTAREEDKFLFDETGYRTEYKLNDLGTKLANYGFENNRPE